MIALGGQVSITHCGGPAIPFASGRKDAPIPTNPKGHLPEPNEPFLSVLDKLKNKMGLDYRDIVALVTGSHSMGGVHAPISPELTNKSFVQFDNTPGVFDNDIFKQTLKGYCPYLKTYVAFHLIVKLLIIQRCVVL